MARHLIGQPVAKGLLELDATHMSKVALEVNKGDRALLQPEGFSVNHR